MTATHGSARARHTLTWLEDRIRTGEWAINAKIPTEPELVEMVGVGRSTIREAVRTLANLGMLETAPGRGTFVRARTPVNGVLRDYLSHQALTDLLELRRALEAEAAALAAERATPADIALLTELLLRQSARCDGQAPRLGADTPGDFHADIFELAGNAVVLDVYQGVIGALRHGLNRGELALAPIESRDRDHAEILACLAAGDADGARSAATMHCSRDLILVAGAPVLPG